MKKVIIFALIIVGVVALVSWNKSKSTQNKVVVNSEQVSEQVLADSILASGNLVFNTQIQIRSEVTGIVTQVLVEEGEYVKQGQILMQLDQTAFAADVANNQAAVNAQKIQIEFVTEQYQEKLRQFELKETLFQQKLLGLDEFERFQSQLTIAQINVKAANERLNQHLASLAFAKDRLNKTTFRASMPGLIAAVDVKPGETVIAGTTNIVGSALMTLADPETILAELRVDEADIATVKPGMAVEVFSAANPKQALTGEVTSIGTSARSSRQGLGLYFRVKVLLSSTEKLFPGMSCRAEIITTKTGNALSVPISAIQQDQGESYVWRIENEKAVKQVVTVGLATDTRQQVFSGLNKEHVVITGPSRVVNQLKEGSQVSQKES
ncbi:efflux RND transporter periplasmic adaptor subunit [Psychrobium sp. 1_MG-2023]|uniref:efflux RND transporter periplasmic adaptor subunit n=1 Tax=Psychrobium sp. 1_MG-2023 TaxID=3062624 RepID=UPI000C32C2E1|nr:efflux RND transporter periplasmic adaptor subunit [Psychrobium sp. 1_MG-2023]MDP2560496.1 efflux RND transporter periplasmic adaptor subunit [Psychrobium sp. 1_MG-2023]PKF55193.1 efflux transporter periplasmic adaptor subunit [Alteromonadales bacterium alter-6D02]